MDRIDEAAADHRMLDAGEVRIHAVVAGEGPTVLFLHGFPESWWSWSRLAPALVAAGYRCVMIDQRGYNLSDRPGGIAAYRADRLVADARGVLDALQVERAHLVAHDWGGAIGWWLAMAHPERIDQMAMLNIPHPARFREALRTPKQLGMSAYMGFFQLPWLPEWQLRRDRAAAMRKWAWRGLAEDAFEPDDVERYVRQFCQPGALTAAINWYRAMARDFARGALPRNRRIDRPTLVLFGEQDKALDVAYAEPPAKLVPDCRVIRVSGAGHFVHHDQPRLVADELIRFFGGGR